MLRGLLAVSAILLSVVSASHNHRVHHCHNTHGYAPSECVRMELQKNLDNEGFPLVKNPAILSLLGTAVGEALTEGVSKIMGVAFDTAYNYLNGPSLLYSQPKQGCIFIA